MGAERGAHGVTRVKRQVQRGRAHGRPAVRVFGWGAVGLAALLAAAPAAAEPLLKAWDPAGGQALPLMLAARALRRPAPPPPAPEERLEDLAAASAILVEAEEGEVLYAHAPRERRPPASLTKIMTAVVVLERARLAEQVVVGPRAREAGGHSMGLRPGQRLTVRDLLAALLVRSANDAAVALAEHVGGTVSGFAALMNVKAKALGMRDTSFRNPHGLDASDHYSTAYDLAILARYAFQSAIFAELVQVRKAVITVKGPSRRRGRPAVARRVLRTHNRLLGAFEGADGVKTGFTSEAGRCLVASAQRDGRRLIAVLLNDPRRWDDAALLLEYGFELLETSADSQASKGLAPPRRIERDGPQVGG